MYKAVCRVAGDRSATVSDSPERLQLINIDRLRKRIETAQIRRGTKTFFMTMESNGIISNVYKLEK
jgi:hypothetical protein